VREERTLLFNYTGAPSLLESAAMREWLRLSADPVVVRRAIVVAIVVGAVLVAINHADALMRGDITAGRLVKILTTVLVPYCVSTYSSVGAMLDARRASFSAHGAPTPRA
jgi:hypothetical protein